MSGGDGKKKKALHVPFLIFPSFPCPCLLHFSSSICTNTGDEAGSCSHIVTTYMYNHLLYSLAFYITQNTHLVFTVSSACASFLLM